MSEGSLTFIRRSINISLSPVYTRLVICDGQQLAIILHIEKRPDFPVLPQRVMRSCRIYDAPYYMHDDFSRSRRHLPLHVRREQHL